MLTLIACTAVGLAAGLPAGYWLGLSPHPRALRIRGFVGRWWTP